MKVRRRAFEERRVGQTLVSLLNVPRRYKVLTIARVLAIVILRAIVINETSRLFNCSYGDDRNERRQQPCVYV